MSMKSMGVLFSTAVITAGLSFAQTSSSSSSTTSNGQSANSNATTNDQNNTSQDQTGTMNDQGNASSQSQTSTDENQPSTSSQSQTYGNAGNPSGEVAGNMQMGRVTKYQQGQSITVRMHDGNTRTWKLNDPNETANVDPGVKVGSRVQISETNNNGQKTLNISPASGQAGASANAQGGMPRTAGEAPLYGLLGLIALAGAVGIRRFGRSNA